MFTGLVEEIGIIKQISPFSSGSRISISASKVLEEVQLGDSIATNGICLTVTSFDQASFTVDVMPETMRHSSLGDLMPGDRVNLERALSLGDRLGGHMVSGHIDGTGRIENLTREDNAHWISIAAPPEILRYIIPRGSIAIDGVSLTVHHLDNKIFKVSIIPQTKEMTTLLNKNIGDRVNLECDMIGKYVERFLSFKEDDSDNGDISLDFLMENGFL